MELDSQESPGEIKSREDTLDSQESPGEIKSMEDTLDSQDSPGEIKSREDTLDSQESPGEIKSREDALDSQESPGEIKSREDTLDSQESSGEIRSREDALDSQKSPEEIKSREVELGCHSRLVCLAAELFLNSCFSDTVFVTFCDRVFGPGCALGLFRDEAFKSFIICNLALQYSMYWIIVSGSSTLLVQLLLRPLHECEQLKSQHIKISHT